MTQLIIICIYLCLLLVLGFFANSMFRGSSKDYMLASHSIGPFLLLMSLFGTTMTAFALVGSTGESYKEGVGVYGLLASSSGIIHSLCFFILGVKLWSLGKKYGYTTQIQFFRDRLESDKIGLLLFPILVGLVIPYLLIGVMASGTVINSMTEGAFQNWFPQHDYGVPPYIASFVICVVVLIYVFFGGMRGTAWANTFQTIVFMILGVVTFFVISSKLGGFNAASEAVKANNPSKLIRGVADEDQAKFDKSWASWKAMSQYNYLTKKEKTLTLDEEQKNTAHTEFKPRMPNWQVKAETVYAKKNGMLAELTIAQKNDAYVWQDDRVAPTDKGDHWASEELDNHHLHKFQRRSGAEKDAFTLYAKKIGHPNDPEKWTRKKARGVYRATHWSPEAPRGIPIMVFITYMFVPLSVGMFPHLFQHWLTAKSANSFKLPVVAHPLFIMLVWVPCVLVGAWATSATTNGLPDGPALIPPHFPPNAVLVYMVKQLTTPLLAGFLTAGILAAIMSSLDSQFLCLGTIFTEDIAVHYGGKDRFTDKQVLIMARCFIIAIVALTYGMSLLEPRRVFTLGVWCFSGFSSLFPLILAALYWKRLTKAGSYACIITAIALWCYFFKESGYASNPHYYVFGMMPVTTMLAGSTAAMILVSLVTPPPSKETLVRFFPEEK